MARNRMKLSGLYNGSQEGPCAAKPPLISAKLLFSMKTTLVAYPRVNTPSYPLPNSLFISPLFFKSMKGSVTGEVGTIVSFWLKGDSLNRGWHRQRNLKYGNDIRNRSLQSSLHTRIPAQSEPIGHQSAVSWDA